MTTTGCTHSNCSTEAVWVQTLMCVFLCCAPTQLSTAVVIEHPGEDRILGEVVAAAVSQVVEVEEILVVAQMAALPLQHVALCCVLRHVVL